MDLIIYAILVFTSLMIITYHNMEPSDLGYWGILLCMMGSYCCGIFAGG